MKTSYLKRYIAFFIWAEVSLIAMAGNSYRTDLLERMATAMNITARIDTLSEGIHYRHLIYNNRRITVIVKNHEVSHIGLADCVLIMRNPDMGYIHSMRMLIDVSTLEERKGLIIARLNSYIPMARVMYLL